MQRPPDGSADLLRSFDRPTDDGPVLYVDANAPVKTLIAASLSRAENLRAWIDLMECSSCELSYQPRDLAAMISPALNDVLTLLRSAHEQLERRTEPEPGAQGALLFSISGRQPKAG